jgi:hypothetical protein
MRKPPLSPHPLRQLKANQLCENYVEINGTQYLYALTKVVACVVINEQVLRCFS